jgi:hypothetical protein
MLKGLEMCVTTGELVLRFFVFAHAFVWFLVVWRLKNMVI